MERILLLTGRPGVGKTTALRRAAETVDAEVSGFYTEEIRQRGRRTGFRAIPFGAGEAVTIAHVDVAGPRVSKYGVDVAALDRVVEGTLGGDAGVWMIDEIGKMECFSEAFVERVRVLLDGDRPVVATVGRGGGLMVEVRNREDAETWEITRGNRDAMPERIAARTREMTSG
ncbi:MAG: AAA family ATPase [Gemmatimonadetes bacterium]|nr:AAA family ATPase [Gemmatimonadota bacterium]